MAKACSEKTSKGAGSTRERGNIFLKHKKKRSIDSKGPIASLLITKRVEHLNDCVNLKVTGVKEKRQE